MTRRSKIETAGLGDKIVGYWVGGDTLARISEQINREHPGLRITKSNIYDHIRKNADVIGERKAAIQHNTIEMTLASVQATLLETVGEIRQYLEDYGDDPKHAANFLKLKLDAIEKMTRMLGGYPPEHQVNVRVNNVFTKEVLEKSMADAEGYFESLERVGGEHAV